MRILNGSFVTAWMNQIINVHPSLLPNFSNLMDLQVHQAVLDQGHTSSGCSVHYVTKNVDQGPLLIQKNVMFTLMILKKV
ncbi:MAG: formyltransferase family protein [bacterium]|nr:formyltransferase family protein [bacterium]